MRIKTKVFWTLLGLSLLVALMGVLAVNRIHTAAMLGVTKEAQDVARVVSFLLMSSSDNPSPPPREIVARLHRTQGRDVVLLDSNQVVLAAAFAASGLYAVKANAGQIQQVIMNIAVNARRHGMSS
jgi:signal transduction histidine kinase